MPEPLDLVLFPSDKRPSQIDSNTFTEQSFLHPTQRRRSRSAGCAEKRSDAWRPCVTAGGAGRCVGTAHGAARFCGGHVPARRGPRQGRQGRAGSSWVELRVVAAGWVGEPGKRLIVSAVLRQRPPPSPQGERQQALLHAAQQGLCSRSVLMPTVLPSQAQQARLQKARSPPRATALKSGERSNKLNSSAPPPPGRIRPSVHLNLIIYRYEIAFSIENLSHPPFACHNIDKISES